MKNHIVKDYPISLKLHYTKSCITLPQYFRLIRLHCTMTNLFLVSKYVALKNEFDIRVLIFILQRAQDVTSEEFTSFNREDPNKSSI